MMITHLRRLTINDIKTKLFDKDVYKGISEWKDFNSDRMIQDDWAKLLISVKGIDLLKSRATRKVMNDTLTLKEIEDIRKIYGDASLTTDKVCSKIEKEQWINSPVMKKYLSFFGYSEEYLTPDEELLSTYNISCENQFCELFDYQYIIRQKILYQLKRETQLKRVIVQMPTGTGKTKTAMHTIINYYHNDLKDKGIILWLAHTSVLVEQAISTFEKTWPIIGCGETSVYRLYDKHSIIDQNCNGFIFATFDKLLTLKRNDNELYDFIKKNVKLIVVDEVHRAVADQMRKCINDMMRMYPEDRSLLGLTATIGRSNSEIAENQKIVDMFNGNIIHIDVDILNQINYSRSMAKIMNNSDKDVIHYLQERKILSKIKRQELEYQRFMSSEELEGLKLEITSSRTLKGDYSDSIIKKLAINRSRNEAIIREIEKLNEQNLPTIVFACSVAHAKLISAILSAKGIKNALVYGNQSIQEKNRFIEQFKDRNNDINIIINYEVLTTGFDSTNIKCVFITRPTKSIVLYSQMIGRGLRGKLMGGNLECLLIDVKDNLDVYTSESAAFNYFDAYWETGE